MIFSFFRIFQLLINKISYLIDKHLIDNSLSVNAYYDISLNMHFLRYIFIRRNSRICVTKYTCIFIHNSLVPGPLSHRIWQKRLYGCEELSFIYIMGLICLFSYFLRQRTSKIYFQTKSSKKPFGLKKTCLTEKRQSQMYVH
jgi:hypothetical protein